MMHRCGTVLSLTLAAVTAISGPLSAAEFGDARRGSETAATLCSNCHALPDGDQASVTDAAPSFTELATRPDITRDQLMTVLGAPEGPMPAHVLSRQDRADVIAYILSLKES